MILVSCGEKKVGGGAGCGETDCLRFCSAFSRELAWGTRVLQTAYDLLRPVPGMSLLQAC